MPVGVAAEASDGTLIVCTQFWLPSALFLCTVHEVTTSSYFVFTALEAAAKSGALAGQFTWSVTTGGLPKIDTETRRSMTVWN